MFLEPPISVSIFFIFLSSILLFFLLFFWGWGTPAVTPRAAQIDPATSKMPYSGVANCAMTILRKEGLLAFWRGFGAYYGRCAPHAMTILMVLEQILAGYNTAFSVDSCLREIALGS